MSPRRTRTLTREAVVTAALDIVDRDGAHALTMRALGRELGVDPMAAYNHVPNKSAVLDGVVEAVWADLELPEPHSRHWREQLAEIARAMRRTLLRHPNALGILATRPNRGEPGLRLVEATLSPLLEAGVEPVDALLFVNAAASFVIGHALAESGHTPTGWDVSDRSGAERHDDDTTELVEALSRIVNEVDHPGLARTLDEVDLEQLTGDRIFETGIAALVAGLRVPEPGAG